VKPGIVVYQSKSWEDATVQQKKARRRRGPQGFPPKVELSHGPKVKSPGGKKKTPGAGQGGGGGTFLPRDRVHRHAQEAGGRGNALSTGGESRERNEYVAIKTTNKKGPRSKRPPFHQKREGLEGGVENGNPVFRLTERRLRRKGPRGMTTGESEKRKPKPYSRYAQGKT